MDFADRFRSYAVAGRTLAGLAAVGLFAVALGCGDPSTWSQPASADKPKKSGGSSAGSTSSGELQVPTPTPDAIRDARDAADRELAEIGTLFDRLSDGLWNGQWDDARETLGELKDLTKGDERFEKLLAMYEQFLDAESKAATTVNLNPPVEQLDDVRRLVREIENSYGDSRLKRISRFINDPDMLPALKDKLEREKTALGLWQSFRATDNPERQAEALIRLVQRTPDSELVPAANRELEAIFEAAREAIESAERDEQFVAARNLAVRWARTFEGVQPFEQDMKDLVAYYTELVDAGGDSGTNGGSGNAGDPVFQAKRDLRELIEARMRTLPPNTALYRYFELLAKRTESSSVRVPPRPMVPAYRVAADQLFAAERFADVDRLLAQRIEAMTMANPHEAVELGALRDYYRAEYAARVRSGQYDASAHRFAYWDVKDAFFAGRVGRSDLLFCVAGSSGSAIFPYDGWKNFDAKFVFDFTQGTQFQIFAKADARTGRGGVMVTLMPVFESRDQTDISQARGLRVQTAIFDTPNSSRFSPEPVTIALRNSRITLDIEVRGESAGIRVNSQRVLDVKLKDNTYFPEKAGVIGMRLGGPDGRIEFSQIKLKER